MNIPVRPSDDFLRFGEFCYGHVGSGTRALVEMETVIDRDVDDAGLDCLGELVNGAEDEELPDATPEMSVMVAIGSVDEAVDECATPHATGHVAGATVFIMDGECFDAIRETIS